MILLNRYRIYYRPVAGAIKVWAEFGGRNMTEAIKAFRAELGPEPIISTVEMIK